MYDEIFYLLGFLFIKHWYVDFVNQTMVEVESKGHYGEWLGLWHSIKHAIGTAIVFLIFDVSLIDSVLLGTMDLIIHYHTDWAKVKYNKYKDYTVVDPGFWSLLGLDQLIHMFTYLFLVWFVIQ